MESYNIYKEGGGGGGWVKGGILKQVTGQEWGEEKKSHEENAERKE